MQWLQVSIAVSSAAIDPVSDMLDGLGYAQLEIVDDLSTIESFLAENGKYWDYVDPSALLTTPDGPYVRLYLADDGDVTSLLDEIKQGLEALRERCDWDLGRLTMVTETVQDEDWTESWKQYFHPISIGRMVIKPPWESAEPWADKVIVDIEPGMTFGTGDHMTTRLCLELLEKLVKPGDRVLDLGCGSGILSAAALMLGAKEAVLVDVDPNASIAVRENMERNHIVPERWRVVIGDACSKQVQAQLSGKYDLVVSNIVADVLLALMPVAFSHVASDGAYLLSGIIDDRQQDIVEGLTRLGFRVACTLHPDDQPWLAIEARL